MFSACTTAIEFGEHFLQYITYFLLSVVAHDEQRVRQLYAEFGLSLIELAFGTWCGRTALLGFQDLAVAASNREESA